jgi:predicted transcriptional regulator
MKTHELLFELSHPIRYEIMQLLVDRPMRLTKIGEKVDANNPEVSRHLDRLKNADLVDKNSDGSYYTTSFGEIIMPIIPSLSFVAAHPDYFLEHDLSMLPPEFIRRLGELESCEILEGTTINLHGMEQKGSSSKVRIYTISNEFVTAITEEHFAGFDQMVLNGFIFRWILPESQLEDKNLMALADHFGTSQNEYFRVIPKVPLFCSIIDEEIMISFLDKKGKADFSVGFNSADPVPLRWGKNLFDNLWDCGTYLSEFR